MSELDGYCNQAGGGALIAAGAVLAFASMIGTSITIIAIALVLSGVFFLGIGHMQLKEHYSTE